MCGSMVRPCAGTMYGSTISGAFTRLTLAEISSGKGIVHE